MQEQHIHIMSWKQVYEHSFTGQKLEQDYPLLSRIILDNPVWTLPLWNIPWLRTLVQWTFRLSVFAFNYAPLLARILVLCDVAVARLCIPLLVDTPLCLLRKLQNIIGKDQKKEEEQINLSIERTLTTTLDQMTAVPKTGGTFDVVSVDYSTGITDNNTNDDSTTTTTTRIRSSKGTTQKDEQ